MTDCRAPWRVCVLGSGPNPDGGEQFGMSASGEQFRDGYVFTIFLIFLVVATDILGFALGAPSGIVGPIAIGCLITAFLMGFGKKPTGG